MLEIRTRRGARQKRDFQGFPNKPLSTEEHNQGQNNDANGGPNTPIGEADLGKQDLDQKQTGNQTEQSRNPQRNLFSRLKDSLWSYKARKFIGDPKIWFELAALVVLICYTNYTRLQRNAMERQWTTMDNTFIEIQKQTGYAATASSGATRAAVAAEKGLELTRQQTMDQKAPYVVWDIATPSIGFGEATGFVSLRMKFSNVGIGLAIDTQTYGCMFSVVNDAANGDVDKIIDDAFITSRMQAPLRSQEDLPAQTVPTLSRLVYLTDPPCPTISNPELALNKSSLPGGLDMIKHAGRRIYAIFGALYRDTFRRRYESPRMFHF